MSANQYDFLQDRLNLIGPARPHLSAFALCSHFDGVTYDPALDKGRLMSQLKRVFDVMADGSWHTLPEIAAAAGGSEPSVSARLRDLRKPKFGSYGIERRRRVELDARAGLHEYRLRYCSDAG